MASLAELLEFLAESGQEDMWLILDVKVQCRLCPAPKTGLLLAHPRAVSDCGQTDDDAEDLVTKTTETIASASEPTRPWDERVVLGCWNVSFTAPPPHLSSAGQTNTTREILP